METNSKFLSFLRQPVALWVVGTVFILSFAGGVLAGGGWIDNREQKVIQGVDAKTEAIIISSTSSTSSTLSSLPDYLKENVSFNLYWDTWNIIKDRFYDKNIPDTQLFYGSLQGLVASLGDPYSIFMTPADADQFAQDLNGNFEGIGAEIAVKNGQLMIVAPLDDSPAMKAGLKAKDYILKVNGTSTEGLRSDQAVLLIRGPKGTEVILTVYREGWEEPRDFKIIRDQIVVKSLSWSYINSGQTALIEVRQFNQDTLPLFEKAINDIKKRSAVKSIVLDLRNNPGGYLEVAVQMAGEWNGDGLVVSEKNRDGLETFHRAYIEERLGDYKTIVLINEGSASASEIVAGALKDWGKASLVGMTTFGKGSVQELDELSDGSQIKLTIAKWFTPSGKSIDDLGIEPDYKVELTEEDFNNDRDPQLNKALEIIK